LAPLLDLDGDLGPCDSLVVDNERNLGLYCKQVLAKVGLSGLLGFWAVGWYVAIIVVDRVGHRGTSSTNLEI
jgi:hypothetical protein